jgi:hypothetical protein
MKKFIQLFLLVVIMVACDYAYDYSYKVTNDCDKPIMVKVKTFRIDSTFEINQKKTKVLFIKDHGVESANGPHFRDVNKDLESFRVSKGDSIFSKRYFLKNEAWIFSDGEYSTTITENEFE